MKATRNVASRSITVSELPKLFKDPGGGTVIRNSLDEITIVINYRGSTNLVGRAIVLDDLLLPLIVNAINATDVKQEGV
jgi:hypothetical protein